MITNISPLLTLTQVGTTDQYFLQLDSRVMYVSRLLFLIISELQKNRSLDQISEIINCSALLSRPITVEQLAAIIKEKIVPLDLSGLGTTMIKKIGTDIRLRVVLFRFHQIAALLSVVRHLFHPILFWPLFFLSASVSLCYLLPRWSVAAGEYDTVWPLFLIAMFVMMLCHEIGHAAASWHNGVEPKEIGMGVYLCFPVFYADVTGIWQLPSTSRIIVNLAGVYMQLLANLVIIGVAVSGVATDWHSFVLQLGLINLFSILTNLTPFFKFDGYWVVADLFHLPNLRESSNKWLKSLVMFRPQSARPVLIIYSLARTVFITAVIVMMVKVIPEFLQNTYAFASAAWHAGNIYQSHYHEMFQRIAGMAFLIYSIGRLVFPLLRQAFARRVKANT
jgi:putative peptide zinc metalloprotease protein